MSSNKMVLCPQALVSDFRARLFTNNFDQHVCAIGADACVCRRRWCLRVWLFLQSRVRCWPISKRVYELVCAYLKAVGQIFKVHTQNSAREQDEMWNLKRISILKGAPHIQWYDFGHINNLPFVACAWWESNPSVLSCKSCSLWANYLYECEMHICNKVLAVICSLCCAIACIN